ncbi:hypothetical protein BN1723_009822 [Verticillium longisporum]|uniref:1,3-beta-glucanosyltransferase n=1 Tax=Verticillium longisporum TaxID=100787 RepID=A0A0G4KSW6_VERLO|nr:hypothetical protein BN1723_009822 [Verticillium longisporum]
MKTTAVACALAGLAIGSASAESPTPTERQAPHRARAVPVVTVSGNAFWANGERFIIRGIDYQPGSSGKNDDPIANVNTCKRDITEFKRLGINAVRIYSLDNSANHDECMGLLADAGIYLMADLNSPKYSINRDDPGPSYNAAYLQSVFATVEEFAKYDNTLLFFSGNEVIYTLNTTTSAEYVKATTRDVKNYMRARGLRQIPVGYSAADISANVWQAADYFNCGSDDARSDFWAFNDYSWCNTDFLTSGWNQKVQNFTDYGIPVFLSEYGCNTNGERKFNEIESLMHSNMTGVYSGGLMFEYTMEENNFGIIEVKNGKVEELPEFGNFASALSKWPMPTAATALHSTTHGVACPTSASLWEVNESLLPKMPQEAEKYMDDGAGTGPGLDGDGSQWNVDSGTATTSVASGTPSPTGQGSSSGGGGGNNGGSGNGESAAAGLASHGMLYASFAAAVGTIMGVMFL